MEKMAQYQGAIPQGFGVSPLIDLGNDIYNKANIENTQDSSKDYKGFEDQIHKWTLDGVLDRSQGSVENPRHGTSTMDTMAQEVGPAQLVESLNFAATLNRRYRVVSVTKEGDPFFAEEIKKMIEVTRTIQYLDIKKIV